MQYPIFKGISMQSQCSAYNRRELLFKIKVITLETYSLARNMYVEM